MTNLKPIPREPDHLRRLLSKPALVRLESLSWEGSTARRKCETDYCERECAENLAAWNKVIFQTSMSYLSAARDELRAAGVDGAYLKTVMRDLIEYEIGVRIDGDAEEIYRLLMDKATVGTNISGNAYLN